MSRCRTVSLAINENTLRHILHDECRARFKAVVLGCAFMEPATQGSLGFSLKELENGQRRIETLLKDILALQHDVAGQVAEIPGVRSAERVSMNTCKTGKTLADTLRPADPHQATPLGETNFATERVAHRICLRGPAVGCAPRGLRTGRDNEPQSAPRPTLGCRPQLR